MKIIKTHKIDLSTLDDWTASQVYNGLDCTVTREVFDAIHPKLDDLTRKVYELEKALQGPILDMRINGIRVDLDRREEVIEEFGDVLDKLERQLQELVGEGLDVWQFNWRSNKDVAEVLYTTLGLPPGMRRSVDEKNLLRLVDYFPARQIVMHLFAMRDLQKKMEVLKTEIDQDGRIRTSYNIGGTTTGRLSSSLSEFGTGRNLQNIEESLRSVFIADRGCKMAYLDAQQGESRFVGAIEWNLFHDGRYLDACETSDLHTSVAKLVWPEVNWTGDPGKDREIAEQRYYRHYDRRYMCKRVGHGSNYGGRPKTLSDETKIEIGLIKDFQPIYFKKFPAHNLWHESVRQRLWKDGFIVSLMERKRWFFKRRTDDATVREAIAYDPQSSLADYLDTGMLNVWRADICQVLLQIHDAVLVQYPEEEEDDVIPQVRRLLEFSINLKGDREFIIPYEVKTGWNWGKFTRDNPDGLKTYHPGDKRSRSEEVGFMGRWLRSTHG